MESLVCLLVVLSVASLAIGQNLVFAPSGAATATGGTGTLAATNSASQTSRATPAVDYAWTDMTGTIFTETNLLANTVCNADPLASQSALSTSLINGLAGRFTRHNWAVIVGVRGSFGFMANYAAGSRYKASCNGNDYYIWGTAK